MRDPGFHIRRAAPGDLDSLVELCAAHAAYECAAYDPAGKRERLGAALFGGEPRLYAWVVERGGRLLGYATATREFSTWDAAFFLHMDCLYLDESLRGLGAGRRLVAEVARLALGLRCVNVQWQTPEWNERAIGFYRHLGAEARSKQRFYLHGDTLKALGRSGAREASAERG